MKGKKAKLRPYYKLYKCPIILHKQINASAIDIIYSKLNEAETLINTGIEDILIANQIVNPIFLDFILAKSIS